MVGNKSFDQTLVNPCRFAGVIGASGEKCISQRATGNLKKIFGNFFKRHLMVHMGYINIKSLSGIIRHK